MVEQGSGSIVASGLERREDGRRALRPRRYSSEGGLMTLSKVDPRNMHVDTESAETPFAPASSTREIKDSPTGAAHPARAGKEHRRRCGRSSPFLLRHASF